MTAALTDALYRQSNGADAPSAAPAPAASPAEAYRAEVLADELKLAYLLGWGNLPTLESAIASTGRFMFGTNKGERGTDARLGSLPMPRWRRDWDGAGELIGRCYISMVYREDACGVASERGVQHWVKRADYPTRDDAIRAAICKAAIAYLTAERARHNERAPA